MSSLVYGESKKILDYRYILTFPMYLILAAFLSRREDSRKFLLIALIIQGAMASMIFIINSHYFPNVLIQLDDYGELVMILDGERTRNMLLGASTSANMILISMFALVSWHFYNKEIINYVFWSLQFYMIYAI
jgi:hypothetical protein